MRAAPPPIPLSGMPQRLSGIGLCLEHLRFPEPWGHLRPSSPHQSNCWEGRSEQLPITSRLRRKFDFHWGDEHSRCMSNVPVAVDRNDNEKSAFRQLLALRTLR